MPPRKRHLLDELRDHGAPPLQIDDKSTFKKSQWPGWVVAPSTSASMNPGQRSHWAPTGDKASRHVRAQRQTSQPDASKANNGQRTTGRGRVKTSTRRQTNTTTTARTPARGGRSLRSKPANSKSTGANAAHGRPGGRAAAQIVARPSSSHAETAVATVSSELIADSNNEDIGIASETEDESEHSSFHPTAEDDGEWEDVEQAWAEEYNRQDGVAGVLDEEADEDDIENERKLTRDKHGQSKRHRDTKQKTSDPTPDIGDDVKIEPLPVS